MLTTRPSLTSAGVARRTLLAGMGSLAAWPAFATSGSIGAGAWLAYEARLRNRLVDAGGGRFEAPKARQLWTLTNAARAADGLQSCGWSDDLALTARAHAADLADRQYVEHQTPEGFDPTHRLGVLARRMIGSASENIAYRQAPAAPSAEYLMGLWRDSPRHWRNVLTPTHAQVGFGVVTRGEHTYAVGLYAHPDGELAAPLPFKINAAADLSHVLEQASPYLESFSLTDPLDQAASRELAQNAVDARLAPGVYQLRPRQRLDARRYQILWGPIFVRV